MPRHNGNRPRPKKNRLAMRRAKRRRDRARAKKEPRYAERRVKRYPADYHLQFEPSKDARDTDGGAAA